KIQHGEKPEVAVMLDTKGDIPWDILHRTVKSNVSLVLCWTTRFDEQRPAPRIDADEPGLPLGSAAPAEDDDEDPDEDEDDADPALGADIEGVSYYVSAPA